MHAGAKGCQVVSLHRDSRQRHVVGFAARRAEPDDVVNASRDLVVCDAVVGHVDVADGAVERVGHHDRGAAQHMDIGFEPITRDVHVVTLHGDALQDAARNRVVSDRDAAGGRVGLIVDVDPVVAIPTLEPVAGDGQAIDAPSPVGGGR